MSAWACRHAAPTELRLMYWFNFINMPRLMALSIRWSWVPLQLPTIELGGSSVRCMMVTIHLPPL
jgi:hypothetical protein